MSRSLTADPGRRSSPMNWGICFKGDPHPPYLKQIPNRQNPNKVQTRRKFQIAKVKAHSKFRNPNSKQNSNSKLPFQIWSSREMGGQSLGRFRWTGFMGGPWGAPASRANAGSPDQSSRPAHLRRATPQTSRTQEPRPSRSTRWSPAAFALISLP
jgi:hypothetical protein